MILNFLIKVLFVTNLWIIIYTGSLDILNFLFPPTLKVATYRNPLAYPEQFEIPLYLVYTAAFVFLICFFEAKICVLSQSPRGPDKRGVGGRKTSYRADILKLIVFTFLLLLFISKLGSFPLAGDPYPYPSFENKKVYTFIFFLYLTTVIFITTEATLLFKKMAEKKLKIFVFIFIFIIALVFTFEPQFSFSPHDAAFFFGPVWEILSGKTLFTDIPSQYGFLSIFVLAIINKVLPWGFTSLPLLVWVFFAVEYSIAFYLFFSVSRSLPFSFFGFFSLFTSNYLALYLTPQAGPLRWFPLFMALFLLYIFHKTDSKKLLFLLPVLSLWNIDSGIALFFGFSFTVFLLFLAKIISLKRLISTFLFLTVSSLLTVFLIQAVNLIWQKKLIDFFVLIEVLRRNTIVGALMVPIEPKTFFWLVLLVYFAAIIYVFKNQLIMTGVGSGRAHPAHKTDKVANNHYRSSPIKYLSIDQTKEVLPDEHWGEGNFRQNLNNIILLFSANLMLFAAIYYVGRSLPHNLFVISPFFLLTLFILLGLIYRQIQANRIKLAILIGIFAILVALPAYQRKEFFGRQIINKLQILGDKKVSLLHNEKLLQQIYSKDISFIKPNIADQKDLIIISSDDTYLFYLIAKRNLLGINPAVFITTKKDMEQALKEASTLCPSRLVIDCSIVNRCKQYKTFTQGDTTIYPIILGNLEKSCQVKYKPTVCSDHLCIAES